MLTRQPMWRNVEKYNSPGSPFLLVILVAGAGTWAAKPCLADWTKTIDCPAGRVYRDVRMGLGRDEFCELHLPGSLKVRDGPARWWFSEGRFGEEGNYKLGRKVGRWRECNRFGRCRDEVYELVHPQEKARGLRPRIPVWYSRGKYVFDFGSCWSTWVTRQTTDSFLELNIGGGLIRCEITYIRSSEIDRSAGNQEHYFCAIPYTVGVREFDSLDLRKELPKAGLPQFCRRDEPSVMTSLPNGPAAQAFAIWVNTRFLNSRTGKEARAWATLANIVDVECAALEREASGLERLTVRLNRYAEQLVLERVGKEEIKADTCGGRLPLSPVEMTRDASGRTLFRYALSQNRATAARQRACITGQIKFQPGCASP